MRRTESVLSVTITRRSALRTVAGAGVALLAVTALAPVAAQAVTITFTVSANANIRAGAGTTFAILGVMRPGMTFAATGRKQNGYAEIVHNGGKAWVIADLVVPAGSGPSKPGTPSQPAPNPPGASAHRTTQTVNLRSGAGTSFSVVRVLRAGLIVISSDTVRNGFRYVASDGVTGWVADAYLRKVTNSGPVPSVLVTTARVNLRAQSSTSSAVKLVLPKGATVAPTSNQQNNFAEVTYQGVKGWVSWDYLTIPAV